MTQIKVGIVGAGPMGKAICLGLLKKPESFSVYICDKTPEKMAGLNSAICLSPSDNFPEDIDTLFIAVKPAGLEPLMNSLGTFSGSCALVSVIAGVTLLELEGTLKHKNVVRAMPNLPVQHGQGVTGYSFSEGFDTKLKSRTTAIFEALGLAYEIKSESQFNGFTALAGCGPAYFFAFAEALAKQAQNYGFAETDALRLAEQTLIGSASMLGHRKNLAELRQSVCSKGGATQEAVDTFKAGNLEVLCSAAMESARKKCEQLSLGGSKNRT